MNSYQRGTAINLVERFWLIDPLTGESTPADPTTVTFTLQSPDGVEQVFTFGIAPNVSNPEVGVYVCALDPQLPTGTYRYLCEGTGAVQATSEDTFEVLASGVLDPAPGALQGFGPCATWIDGDDVSEVCLSSGVGSDTFLLDDVAWQASSLMYELTGRQFPGVCERTVRPCRDSCGCWGDASGVDWSWSMLGYSHGFSGWGWYSEGGNRCGCEAMSVVRLAGYPVQSIREVKIGGELLPEFDPVTSLRNWRLDMHTDLVRMDGTDGAQRWPSCQSLTLDDDQPGTFSISYLYGVEPPSLGRDAAAALACELWKAGNGQACSLPSNVTRVTRNGVTIERVISIASMLRKGATGIALVDAFIAATNPTGMIRRPAVWSPDLQPYARKVG